jgi:hypothetical protein
MFAFTAEPDLVSAAAFAELKRVVDSGEFPSAATASSAVA